MTQLSFLKAASNAAREAGQLALAHAGGKLQIDSKHNRADLVTQIDRQAEARIREILLAAFPSHQILGEEQGGAREAVGYRWIVDPIDGTLNFVSGFPFYCTSIALELDGELQLGVIYEPERDMLFHAELGRGAFCNGDKIQVSHEAQLDRAMLATGFNYHEDARKVQRVMAQVSHMVAQVRGVRRAGSAALDLAYTAAGHFDGYWEADLKPWDAAAGVLLLREAGGRVSGLKGEPYRPGDPVVVASNGLLHNALCAQLQNDTSSGWTAAD